MTSASVPHVAALNLDVHGSDLLIGDALVEHLFGPQPDLESRRKARRKLYHLVAETAPEHRPPVFRFGARVYAARRSSLQEWYARREAAAAAVPQKIYRRHAAA
jgi:hypothetical protein